jgi:hypothetical protein
MRNNLTALKVARLAKPGRHGDGGGLYLRVAEYRRRNGALAQSKNWIFRYRIAGRTRWMGLGSINGLSLAQARLLVREFHVLLVRASTRSKRAWRAGVASN